MKYFIFILALMKLKRKTYLILKIEKQEKIL